jgi:hypothetical protein
MRMSPWSCDRVDAGLDHVVQRHRLELGVVGAGVVEELVDDGVELVDVGRHVLARVGIGHAHLGFQAQARQRRAQVVRDAGQHDGAVLLDLGQLLRHAVEADVHLADLAGDGASRPAGWRRSRRRARGWRRTTAA